jgi:hypothetical protein
MILLSVKRKEKFKIKEGKPKEKQVKTKKEKSSKPLNDHFSIKTIALTK